MRGGEERLRFAFVYDAIYPYANGGAERRVYEMGRLLAAEGHDVHLYGMKYWPGPRVEIVEGMKLHGICKARGLYTRSGRRKISEAVLFGLAATQLIFARFDVIDCSGFPYFSLIPTKLAALVNRKPLVATWHEVWGLSYWNDYLGWFGFLGAAVEWTMSRMPTTIIAVSERTAEELRTTLRVRAPIHVVPNGIELGAVLAAPPSVTVHDVVTVGRLITHKNVDLIIQAIERLQNGHELSLLVIGDGPERGRLQQLVDASGLSDRVSFVGFVESAEVYGYLKAAKVLVLASSREGFGMVVLEANACGLPVVTIRTPHNAAADLISDGINGFVAQPDADSLAEMILRALSEGPAMTPAAGVARYEWAAATDLAKQVYFA